MLVATTLGLAAFNRWVFLPSLTKWDGTGGFGFAWVMRLEALLLLVFAVMDALTPPAPRSRLAGVTMPHVRLALLLSLSCSALAAPLPACAYEDRRAALTGYDDWPYTLLDTLYALPESYAPEDLQPLSISGVGTPEMQVRAAVLPDLRALLRAAEAAGVGLEVQSAYRSYTYQKTVFEGWVAQDGLEAALKTSARPGHSEHQLGTALDFRSADGPPAWELTDWRETPEGAWLARNAARFGFVMSYPAGQEAVTCYSYEPWHYRYLGREAAAELGQSGLTLREWLWTRQ